MSSVVDQGAIRNVVRGIDETPFCETLFEIIDDRQHSASKKVFIDLNTREKKFIIGFENHATKDQINNMVKWHATQGIHNDSGLATAGLGLKYYEYLVRAEHTHATYNIVDEPKKPYITSKSNSTEIFNAARDTSLTELEFSQKNSENTKYADCSDEIIYSLSTIFKNEDNVFPFTPATVICSKDISNETLLNVINNSDEQEILRRELNNKYFHEIKSGDLQLFIKFPSSTKFYFFDITRNVDTIGSTIGENKFPTQLYEVKDTGEIIVKINDAFYSIKKNGSSAIRQRIIPNPSLETIIHLFTFDQYTIPKSFEEIITNHGIIGKSMETYSGIYLRIGNHFINSHPMPSTLIARNLYGSKLYRGILSIAPDNAENVKKKMRLNGLKSSCNLSDMKELEFIIKQVALLFKKYVNATEEEKSNPDSYVCVNSTNVKSKTKEKLGVIYILKVGPQLYKLGIAGKTNKSKRIFNYFSEAEYEKVKEDFKDATVYEKNKVFFVYLSSCEIKNSCSLEQQTKEYFNELENVIAYNTKKGDDIREYFTCDSLESIEEIKNFIITNSKY
jgi:hypothetical protein